jgi:hypothetical protein
LKFSHILRRLSDRERDKKYGWILAEACWVWNVSALSADGRACNNGKRVSALHRRLLERFIRMSFFRQAVEWLSAHEANPEISTSRMDVLRAII